MEEIRFSVIAKETKSMMYAIYIHCKQGKAHYDCDTRVRVFKDEWSNGLINSKNPNYKKLNIYINNVKNIFVEAELNSDKPLLIADIVELDINSKSSCDFFAFMEEWIPKRGVSNATIQIQSRALSHLKRYKDKTDISELTEEFVEGFHEYLLGIGLKKETAHTYMSALKVYYNLARKIYGDKVPSNSFGNYHKPRRDRFHHYLKSLSDEDIRYIENAVVQPNLKEEYRHRLEQFLFMSYTGARISDYNSFNRENLIVEEGRIWLQYLSVKTKINIRVPLASLFDGRAEQIANKYKDNIDYLLHCGKDCSFNSKLNTALKHIGFKKHVTAHCARHTFASRLVSQGIPITTIQLLLGHTNTEMTMVYAKTNEKSICKQLER